MNVTRAGEMFFFVLLRVRVVITASTGDFCVGWLRCLEVTWYKQDGGCTGRTCSRRRDRDALAARILCQIRGAALARRPR